MKIAFVIPWYGENIPGGAESECRRTAENLFKAGTEVEILTTCVREFESDWNQNFHREGEYRVNGILVRRFKVRKRDTRAFDRINYKLMNNLPISLEEEKEFIGEMINSDNLYKFIEKNKSNYYFIFIPYMFGTTYWGLQACPERSILIPCLHDESYAYLKIYKEMFKEARAVIFHSQSELELASRLYNLKTEKSFLIGEGVDAEFKSEPEKFCRRKNLDGIPFILYAGRKAREKNTPLLISYFSLYKRREKSNLKLLLMGTGEADIPEEFAEDIIDLGFLSREEKYDAYGAATLLCQPSLNESFSLAIMESWLSGTAVLVHGDCEVTKEHVLKSNGGLYLTNYPEFEESLEYLLEHPEVREKMARNGRKYVLENFSWGSIISKYKELFSKLKVS
jgi:glycosyltransferase involved in cell wall biosynthesis